MSWVAFPYLPSRFYDGFFDHLQGFQAPFHELWIGGAQLPTGDTQDMELGAWLMTMPCLYSKAPTLATHATNVLVVLCTLPDIKPAGTMLCTGKIKHVKSGYLPQFEALMQPREVKNIKLTLAAACW
ncbi:hypothetical protein BKA83DRAFT_4128330 [Pisolithus microcarpus]|nr:hypothetical protein BKA83DRAFT_4128330 [Pisolithus microcarpus]